MKSRLCSLRFSSFLRIFFLCVLLFASSFFASAQTTWSGNVSETHITAVNTTITLTGNTTISALWIEAKNITINLNGYTLTVTDFYLGGATTGTDASVTIKNSGTSGEVSIDKYDVANTTTTSLTLENVTVRVTRKYYLDTGDSTNTVSGQGTTSINGTGTFDVTEATTGTTSDGSSYPSVSSVVADGSGITVVTSHSEMEVKVYYWTGATNNEWTTSTNWAANAERTWSVKSGTYPGSADGDTAVFPTAGAGVNNLSLAGADYSLTLKTSSFFGNNQNIRITIVQTGDNADTANITLINGWFLFDSCSFGNLTIEESSYANITNYTTGSGTTALAVKNLNIKATGQIYGAEDTILSVSESFENKGEATAPFNIICDGSVNNSGRLGFKAATLSGDVTNTGTITGGAGAATFGGKFTNNYIFTGGSGNITFNGDVENNYTIDCGSGTVTFKDNYVNGSIDTNEAIIQASTADTIFYKNVDFSSTSASNFMHNSGTVKFLGESAKVITTDTLTFNNVSIDSGKLEIAGDVTVGALLSMKGGTSLVVDSGKTLSLTQFSDEGTSVCKLEINGTLKPSVDTAATMTLNNVDVTVGSTGVISGSNVTADLKDVSTLTNSGSVTLKSITNAKSIVNTKNISVTNILSADNIENSKQIYISGGVTSKLSFASYTGDGNDNVLMNGGEITSTSEKNVTIGTISVAGQTNCTNIDELTIEKTLIVYQPFSVSGSLTVNGTGGAYSNLNANITTTGAQTYKGTATVGGTCVLVSSTDKDISFNKIEIASGKTLTFGTATSKEYAVSVSGNWTNNGTLIANQSTVTFKDTATISGDTTFYNLALDAGGKKITISDAQTVSGALTLKGQAGNLLSLSGSGHFIVGTADFSGEYLSIDSSVEIWKTGAMDAVAGLFAVTDSAPTDSNAADTVFSHGWKIGDMAFVWTGAVSPAWETAGNWRPAIVPGATGSEGVDVTIPDGVASGNYPDATTAYSVKTLKIGTATASTHSAKLTISGANNIKITGTETGSLTNYGKIIYAANGRVVNGNSTTGEAINDAENSGTVEFSGTSQTINAMDYANLIVSGTATATDAITVSGTLSLSGTGTKQFNAAGGSITSTIASIECTMTGGSVQIGGDRDTSSTFKVSSGTLSLPSALSSTKIGGTVECASQTYNCPITLTGQPTTFKGTTVTFAGNVLSNSTPPLSYGLKVDGNAVFKADVTSSGDIEVTGTTKTQGASVTLDAKGADSTNGKMTLSGAVVLGATSTTLKSIDDMTFGSTIEGASAKSNAVTFSAKTAVFGTAKPISITGAVGSSVPLGAVSVAGGTLSAGGNFGAKSLSIASASTFKAASSSTVTLSGNFSNSGTFTHNNSTVVFSDTAMISGSSTFYDLKCTTGGKTLSVADTQTVLNTLTLKGADGNLLGISGSGTLVCSESNFSAEYLSIGGDIKIAENASSVVAGAFTAENSVPIAGVSISAVFQNGWKLSNDLAIIETIAPVGSKKIALMFNSMLYSGTGSLLTKSADLSALESEMSIEAANGETYDVEGATLVSNSENSAVIVLEISSRITLDDVKEGFVVMNATSTAFFGEGNRTLSSGTKHCVSHFVAGAVEVLYAKANSAAFDSDAYTVREFSKDAGKEGRIFFSGEDGYKITVATHVATKADANGNLDFTEDFDDSLLLFAKKSTPSSSDLTLFKNALGIQGQSAGASYLKNFSLDFSSGSLSACASGDTVEFMFALASSDGSLFKRSADTKNDIALPVLRLSDPSDIKSLDTWRFTLSAIKAQRGGVTILNNVINSRSKEKTTIVVDTEKSSALKVYVMTLDGSIVRTLEKSRVKSGRHTYTWDGTNGAGKSVARGMYFVRVIGDDIDETRKVMVVKE